MKICFVQKQLFPYFGIMALSGILKQHGHESDILINASEPDLLAALESIQPDIIGFSVISTEHRWFKKSVLKIKSRFSHIPIIVGGIHVIFYPMDVLKLAGVDYICWGEGEIALPMLLDRLEKGEKNPEGIKGIGYFNGGTPILQGVAPLIENIDSFREDREIYYCRYPELRDLSQKIFISSRGCPYKCSFCGNRYIMETFKGAGKYIRRKSPRFFMEEIRDVLTDYGASSFFFCDDLFVMDIKWLDHFSCLYQSEIDVHYICTGRAGSITERHVKALSSSGCHTISFGVETGNEKLRRTILNKNITNRELLKCSSLLKSEGIEIQTSNMFCLPDETIEDAVSTIDLNIKMGTDYMFTAIFLPFPKTELANYCIEKQYLSKDYSFEDMPDSFIVDSVLDVKDKEYMVNMHKISHLCIRFPKIRQKLIWAAKTISCKSLFFLLYLCGTFIRYKEERKLTFLENLRYLWTYRKGY